MFSTVESRVIGLIDRLYGEKLSVKDSFVITGFWRSGTTWLQCAIAEAVQGRSVFEPFHWKVEEYLDLVNAHLRPPTTVRSYLKAFMPYCSDFEKDEALCSFIQGVMTGSVRASWLHRGRSIMLFPPPSRAVVKFVRGQLIQPAYRCDKYPALIHMRRDPRAVLASLLRDNWGRWMHNLSLRDQLLRPDDGRAKYFSRWTEDIEKADRDTFPVRAATYWALTERFVSDQGLPESGGVLIRYEEACLERDEYLNQVLSTMLPDDCPIKPKHLGGDSPTTQNGRSSVVEDRIYGWKDELTTAQIEDVESVVRRFELDDSLIE